MNAKLLDIIERVGWTFIQAVAATVVSAGTAADLHTFDWRAALTGAGTAAAIALLKQLGVNASVALLAAKAPAAPSAPPVAPAPEPTITNTQLIPVLEHEHEDELSTAAISAAAARRRGPFLGS
jgi:hypothetical protein